MSDRSHIEWTDATWNPVTGCTKVSPGCKHCYAERFRGVVGHPYEQGFDLRTWPDRLQQPLHWSKPRRIFVNSMSDLFHPDVGEDYIRQVFDVMAEADWHQYQVLTKRPERAATLAAKLDWPEQVWMGTSVENQDYVGRIDELRKIPAQVRFLSCEPLLGPLELDLDGIHWVIVGGESGPGARKMAKTWVRDIRKTCRKAEVPFFFKQWGASGRRRRAANWTVGRTMDFRVGGAPWTYRSPTTRRSVMCCTARPTRRPDPCRGRASSWDPAREMAPAVSTTDRIKSKTCTCASDDA